MSNISIAGGGGFVGTELKKKLHSSYFFSRDELFCEKKIAKVVVEKKIDTVIYLAGLAHNKFPLDELKKVNISLVLDFARMVARNGVKRFVFLSTVNVHEDYFHQSSLSISTPLGASSDLAKSKIEAEKGLRAIENETSLEVVIVRSVLVYGPNAPGNFGSLVRLIESAPFLPFRLVSNKRDFISVYNLVDLLATCAVHPNAGGHTFLASDLQPVSMLEFTNAIAKGLGKNIIQLPIPIFMFKFFGIITGKYNTIDQLVGDLYTDSKNLNEILHWEPPYCMDESMQSLSFN